MNKLAINGGTPVFTAPADLQPWPPVYPETAEALKELYLNHMWSFYAPQEVKFNEEFAAFTGSPYAVMMANGTVTLELALQALDIGPGDEVIVPAQTWIATGEAVVYRGATPVIVDIEPDTLCMDPAAFEAAITPRTRAVIPVHLFGSMADIEKICAIAEKHQIRVIEDCAHAHGGFWAGHHVGTFGVIGSFSFQQSKLLSSGEGGAVITSDEHLWDLLGRLSHIGYQRGTKQGQKCPPPPMGLICHNYRVTDFQALILRSQLAHLLESNKKRAANAEILRKNLNAIPGISVQAPGRKATLQSYYAFVLKVDPEHLKPGIDRQKVSEALAAEGISVGPGWRAPMYRQNLWSVPESMYRIESNANAERIMAQEYLQFSHHWLLLPETEINKVIEAFRKVMAEYGC